MGQNNQLQAIFCDLRERSLWYRDLSFPHLARVTSNTTNPIIETVNTWVEGTIQVAPGKPSAPRPERKEEDAFADSGDEDTPLPSLPRDSRVGDLLLCYSRSAQRWIPAELESMMGFPLLTVRLYGVYHEYVQYDIPRARCRPFSAEANNATITTKELALIAERETEDWARLHAADAKLMTPTINQGEPATSSMR